MLGSANLSGGPLLHTMTGNLSHQIEHHIFPDIPSNRYIEIAPRVREICERYGLPYTTGPLPKQYGKVLRKITVRAAPPRGERRRPGEAGRLVRGPARADRDPGRREAAGAPGRLTRPGSGSRRAGPPASVDAGDAGCVIRSAIASSSRGGRVVQRVAEQPRAAPARR